MAKKRSWQLNEKYTLAEVSKHQSLDDCWMVIFDKVYNITQFVNDHPGGEFILLEYAGRDATQPFLNSRHGSSAYKMLDKYWIGILVDEELFYSNNSSYCSVYSNLSWKDNCCVVENEIDQEEPKPGGDSKARDSGGGGGNLSSASSQNGSSSAGDDDGEEDDVIEEDNDDCLEQDYEDSASPTSIFNY